MSFDRLAPHYCWMERVLAGEKLQRCRTAFLEKVTTARNVLVVGEGNGRFLVECRRELHVAKITVVDASRGMLEQTRQRLSRAKLPLDDVEFIHADALNWKPPEPRYDLIVTHFFLDCFPQVQLEKIVNTLADATEVGAFWLLADFQVPACGWKRLRAQAIHRCMYAFFRAATQLGARELVCPDRVLSSRGFRLLDRHTSDWDLLHTDLWMRG